MRAALALCLEYLTCGVGGGLGWQSWEHLANMMRMMVALLKVTPFVVVYINYRK